jgi:hypothetical protein
MKGEIMKKFRALSCFIFALCLVFYAIPRLPAIGISELASGFSLIWMLFAFLVIGANLMYVIGDDRTGVNKNRRRRKNGNRQEMTLKKKRVYANS